ncbi:B30.2/SPRY domain [Macleaya cordata]|uniref:B30.2/SPRY domain n=1 Tax=Macleaya cordata TaxID=56857 RepID=A0A200QL72_MACCD|nr:B30.2/SPRY domain [Macleaya cordata]
MKQTESLQSGIAKLQLQYEANDHKNFANYHHLLDLEKKRRTNYYVFRRGLSVKPLFSWADHPSLVSEAVEHGWSRFAFTGGFMSSSSSSTRSVLLGLCVSGDQGKESKAEISWEVCPGSSDFMQKIRLNSGLKKGIIGNPSPLGASSVIKTALPLPGPFLGNYSFPQEAYFEITILSLKEDDDESVESIGNVKESKKREGEKTKLIQETQEVNSRSDSLTHVSIDSNRFEELKVGNKEESKEESVIMSLGLTVGGTLPSKLPGSYPGSIGFNSNGSVYLDGMDLMFETQKAEWGTKNKVIGCGFDPDQKKVFFTVDSELVHVIHCSSEEFSSPLYPTLAANVHATVLVNFGQSAFSYAPPNVQRTPNPCFLGPLAFGSEDSQELFSIGRIDSQWSKRRAELPAHLEMKFNELLVHIKFTKQLSVTGVLIPISV